MCVLSSSAVAKCRPSSLQACGSEKSFAAAAAAAALLLSDSMLMGGFALANRTNSRSRYGRAHKEREVGGERLLQSFGRGSRRTGQLRRRRRWWSISAIKH